MTPDPAPSPSLARRIRRIVLRESKRAHVGHIGSCLCVAEILSALYGNILRITHSDDPDRDRFILSKGHAGLALFAALSLKGWISDADLATFCGNGSLLGVHPEAALPGVDFSTGSLGQGLSLATGAALAARLQRSTRRIYCLISDAECNEGGTWEAAQFAAHHHLENLTAILDLNGQQAFGRTSEVLDAPNMPDRWRAFGWDVIEVDGHSEPALNEALTAPPVARPRIVIAHTTFGKGVSYMEQGIPVTQTHLATHPINWHYLPMSDAEYQTALAETETS